MIRQIIRIDEERCDGCGLCAEACHEGAISIIEGKARLVHEAFCDGLGNCLPACPAGAISFESREAPDYNEEAAKQAQEEPRKEQAQQALHEGCACPGSRIAVFSPKEEKQGGAGNREERTSQLRQWPVQIKLVPATAPFFGGCELLIAADCTAYACAAMHEELMRGRVTLIGCPKLDGADYSEKLAAIISQNEIWSVTVAKMEVPCCTGLQIMAEKALKMSGKRMPYQAITISREGMIRG